MALKAFVKLAVESGHSPEFYSYLRDERIYDETSVGKLTRVSTSGCIRMCVCACVESRCTWFLPSRVRC